MKANLIQDLIARAMFLMAAGICVFLTILGLTSSEAITGCGNDPACSAVMSSSWARFLGGPIALIGGIVYLAAALIPDGESVLRRAFLVATPLAALWFVGVQAFAVGAFCLWCCMAHFLASGGALVSLWIHRDASKTTWVPSMGIGFAMVLGVVLIQVTTMEESLDPSSSNVVVAFQLEQDGVEDAADHELPSYGNRDAIHKAVLLADFSCSSCRELSQLLRSVAEKYPDLEIIKFPAMQMGTDSEVLHRYLLALWKVNPHKYDSLETKLMSGAIVDDAAAVEKEAIRLVGANRFAESLVVHGEWISQQMAVARSILERNRDATGKEILPQLIVGDEVVMGGHSDPEYYAKLFDSKFGQVADGALPPEMGIVLKKRLYDLGRVAPGNPVRFSVGLANHSNEELELGWFILGAGLSLDGFSRGEISPGDEGVIKLALNVPENTPPGRIERSVTINPKTGHGQQSFRILAMVGHGGESQF